MYITTQEDERVNNSLASIVTALETEVVRVRTMQDEFMNKSEDLLSRKERDFHIQGLLGENYALELAIIIVKRFT